MAKRAGDLPCVCVDLSRSCSPTRRTTVIGRNETLLALKGDDREEAEHNLKAARLWIFELETVKRKLGITRIIDLSVTPFFLRRSGYAEGTSFPRTMSDAGAVRAVALISPLQSSETVGNPTEYLMPLREDSMLTSLFNTL
jgi:hypothetical protein